MANTVQLKALKPSRITDEVYDILREKVLSCEFGPGQRLHVDQISQQLGISRTPVKDALQRLYAEGLIEIHARKGTFVAQANPEDIRETSEVREALELMACELMAGKLDSKQIRTLRQMNDKIRQSGETDHDRLNHQFHRTLVEYSGNRRLLEMYLALHTLAQIARIHFGTEDWTSAIPKAVEEHAKTINALAKGDAEAAKKILSVHIRSTAERLISQIAKKEQRRRK